MSRPLNLKRTLRRLIRKELLFAAAEKFTDEPNDKGNYNNDDKDTCPDTGLKYPFYYRATCNKKKRGCC
jgi:hypothetical protein